MKNLLKKLLAPVIREVVSKMVEDGILLAPRLAEDFNKNTFANGAKFGRWWNDKELYTQPTQSHLTNVGNE